jgi:hypothetical protein
MVQCTMLRARVTPSSSTTWSLQCSIYLVARTMAQGPVQLAIATDPGPADQGQVSWAAATAGQGSWGQA